MVTSILKINHTLTSSLALISLVTFMHIACMVRVATRVLPIRPTLGLLPVIPIAVQSIARAYAYGKPLIPHLFKPHMPVTTFASTTRKPFFDTFGRVINPSARQRSTPMEPWVYDALQTLPTLKTGTQAEILRALITNASSHYYRMKSTGMCVDVALTKNREQCTWWRKALTPEKILAWGGNEEQRMWWNRKLRYENALKKLNGKPGTLVDLSALRKTMQKSINDLVS